MLQWLGLGWILGIACMGKMWLDYHIGAGGVIFSVLIWLMLERWIQPYLRQISIFSTFFTLIFSLFLGIWLGFGFANNALDQRLSNVVHEPSSQTLIVYIEHLNELSENTIQQKITVLNVPQNAIENLTVQYLAYVPKAKEASEQLKLELGKYYRLNGVKV